MKKQSLFIKALQGNKADFTQQASQPFPRAVKLNKEQIQLSPRAKKLKQMAEEKKQIQPDHIPPLEQRAQFHKLSVEEYQKIHEENLKTLNFMEEDKILGLQAQIREHLGANLTQILQEGKLYDQSNQAPVQTSHPFVIQSVETLQSPDPDSSIQPDIVDQKEPVNTDQPESNEMKEQTLADVNFFFEQQDKDFQEEIQKQVEKTMAQFQQKFKEYTPEELKTFTKYEQIKFVLGPFSSHRTTLGEIKAMFMGTPSSNSLALATELFELMLDQLYDQFHKSNMDCFVYEGYTIYRHEILQYLEGEQLKMSEAIFMNFRKIFKIIKYSSLNFLAKWLGFIVYKPWSLVYDQLEAQQIIKKQYSKYKELIKKSTLDIKVVSTVYSFPEADEKLFYENQILLIMRVIQMMTQEELELSTHHDKWFTSKEFAKNIKISKMSHDYQGFTLGRKVGIIFDHNQADIEEMLMSLILMIVKHKAEVWPVVNQIIPQIGQSIQSGKCSQNLLAIIRRFCDLYEKHNSKDIKQLINLQNVEENTEFFLPENLLPKFFKFSQDNAPIIYLHYFSQMILYFEINFNRPERLEIGFRNLSLFLQSFKLYGKLTIVKSLRISQIFMIADQARAVFANFLQRYTLDRVYDTQRENSATIVMHHYIICRILGIVFYRHDKTLEIVAESAKPLQGYLNLVFYKKILQSGVDPKKPEEGAEFVKKFQSELECFLERYLEFEVELNYEFLFIKMLRFLCIDENIYADIDQKKFSKLLEFVVKKINWKFLTSILNINVSYFERFVQKLAFDSYDSAIFCNIIIVFTIPDFIPDIVQQAIRELDLNKHLDLVDIDLTDFFIKTPTNANSIHIETTKQLARTIGARERNPLIKKWNDAIQSW